MSNYAYQEPNEAEITQDVTKEVEGEIAAETAPLTTLVGQTERNRDRALEEIGEAFGFVVDASRQSATRLSGDYQNARIFEKSIFDAATQELAAIRGEAASEAQRMAQLTGGPVDLEAFLKPSLLESGLASSDFASAQLMHSGFGQANVALAESYAGQTFPLMRAREKKAALNHFDDQIASIQKEIATIKQSKGTRVSKASRERLLQEREYALQKAQSARDWWATQQGVNIEKSRIKLEKQRLGEETRQFDESLDFEKEKVRTDIKQAGKEAASSNRIKAGELLRAVTTPGQQTIEFTEKVPATLGDEGAFPDATSETGYARYITRKEVVSTATMTRPDGIYHYLLGQGVPDSIALFTVRQWLAEKGVSNAKKWVPGAAKSPEKADKGKGKPDQQKGTREGTRPDSAKTEGKGGEGRPQPQKPPGEKVFTDKAHKPFGGAEWRKGKQGTGWYWFNPIDGQWYPVRNKTKRP